MPDQMANMMDQKIGHPNLDKLCMGASPTAAIHSMHYHKINVFEEQNKLNQET